MTSNEISNALKVLKRFKRALNSAYEIEIMKHNLADAELYKKDVEAFDAAIDFLERNNNE